MKNRPGLIGPIVLAVIAGLLLASAGCAAANHEGFAIYLTRGDTPPAQMPVLSQVELAEQPMIAVGDIITYDAQDHELELTASALERLSRLDVPVRGRLFVVCVDRQPIYWGAFWTPISSMSFDGVTIWKPIGPEVTKVIRLQLGYPGASFYRGEDPRNNAVVIKSLQDAGKLTSALPADPLPRSMKGYELYSWPEDGEWRFSLITGTNRNKTLEEIFSGADVVSPDGWVHLRVTGVEAVQALLGRLPGKESVIWLDGLGSEPASPGGAGLSLPPGPVVDAIKGYALGRGLDFNVQAP